MRLLILLLMVVLVVAVGNYWFNPNLNVCRLPVEYSIGSIDDRFGVSEQEAQAALAEAEAIWEGALGNDEIFQYKQDAPLRVNFIYDERQAQSDRAELDKGDLSVRGEANEVLVELHKRLVEEYEESEAEYEARLASYETRLTEYNAEVERYNSEGGAPPDEYEELENKKAQLDEDRKAINELGETMDDLVEQINSVGEKGNELIEEYNERVNRFNDTYSDNTEYTQGDYRAREVNVYAFNDNKDLVLVLAHEFGHALSIDHVDNEHSIMYYLMGEQPEELVLSEEDISAFDTKCGGNFLERWLVPFVALYN